MRPPIMRNAILLLLAALPLVVVRAQSPEPLKQIATIALPNVAGRIDHLAFDAQRQRLFVAALGNDTVEVLDAARNAHLKSLAGFHEPQGIAVASDFGAIVVANGDTGTVSSQVVVGDRQAGAVVARWSSLGCRSNYPMALDEATMRLFLGCRLPARLAVLDSRSGDVTTSVDIVGDTDDLVSDAARQRIYVIGGEGFVDVLQRRAETIERAARVATRAGARTEVVGRGDEQPLRRCAGSRRPRRRSAGLRGRVMHVVTHGCSAARQQTPIVRAFNRSWAYRRISDGSGRFTLKREFGEA